MRTTIFKSRRLSGNCRDGYFYWFSETPKINYESVEVDENNFKEFKFNKFIKAEYRKSRTFKFGKDCNFYKKYEKLTNL